MATATKDFPKLGDEVWYRLDEGFYGEWVPAKVIDRSGDAGRETVYDEPLGDELLHLEIELNRRRHHSATTRGVRLNVEEGTGYGQWQRQKPTDADIVYQRDKERAALREEANREIMRAQAPR